MLQSAPQESTQRRAAAIGELDRWLARGYEPPQPAAAEARLIIAGRWMLNGRPDHPVIAVWAARCTRCCARVAPARLKSALHALLAGSTLRPPAEAA